MIDLPSFDPSKIATGAALNKILAQLRKLTPRSSPTVFVNESANGWTPEARPSGTTYVPNPWYPFRLYQVPASLIAVPDTDNDWRKVRVRSGQVGTQAPEDLVGSDQAELSYDGSDMPVLASGNWYDIPDGQAKHWFWIQLDEGGAHTVEHAVEASGTVSGWDTFPEPAGRIVIGWVDTLTGTAEKTLYFNPEPFANRHMYGTLNIGCDGDGNTRISLNSV